MGENNLISLADRTTDEQREIATKGGEASGVARRKKKMMEEAMRKAVSMRATEKISAQLRSFGYADEELINLTAVTVGLMQKAMKGDVSAFNAIRDLLGEKPKDELQLTGFGKLEIGFVESEYDPVESEDDIK